VTPLTVISSTGHRHLYKPCLCFCSHLRNLWGAVCGFSVSMVEIRETTTGAFPLMDRRIDEWDYVVRNLYRSRRDVIARPERFDPDTLQRIDKAIASIEEIRLAAKAA